MLGYLSLDIICSSLLSFPRASFSENCPLLGTDYVRGQISEHIFAPNGYYCLFIPSFIDMVGVRGTFWIFLFLVLVCYTLGRFYQLYETIIPLVLDEYEMIRSFGFNRKNILRPQQSLDWLKIAGKPRIGVFVYSICFVSKCEMGTEI